MRKVSADLETNGNMESAPGEPLETDQWVKLNVGGTLFTTTKLTLTRVPGSFLSRICDDDFGLKSTKDPNGAYLIDRDPRYFRVILNYLRNGELIVDDGLAIEGILKEAEFYNLDELVKMVEKKIDNARWDDYQQDLLARSLNAPRQYKAEVHRSPEAVCESINRIIPDFRRERVEQLVLVGNYAADADRNNLLIKPVTPAFILVTSKADFDD